MQPFSGPRITGGKITDTRLFLIKATLWPLNNTSPALLKQFCTAQNLHKKQTFSQRRSAREATLSSISRGKLIFTYSPTLASEMWFRGLGPLGWKFLIFRVQPSLTKILSCKIYEFHEQFLQKVLFAVDFWVDFFLLFFSKEKDPKKSTKNPPENSPRTLFGKIPLGFLQKPFLTICDCDFGALRSSARGPAVACSKRCRDIKCTHNSSPKNKSSRHEWRHLFYKGTKS